MATAITQYEDFVLALSREGDQYMAEVRESPAGPSHKVRLKWPFGNQPHDVLLVKLENAILKGRGYRAGPITSEERVLREFGSDVFSAVFRNSDEIAIQFAASLRIIQSRAAAQNGPPSGLRIVFRVDPPELAMLPWEYMFDQATVEESGKFICLRKVSSLVRFVNVAAPPTALRASKPLRILGMIANPGGPDWKRLDTEAERHRIEEALKPIPRDAVQLEWVAGGTRDDLFVSLQRESWHIFHFIGHGGTQQFASDEGQVRSEGFVVMQDGQGGADVVSASDLGMMLDTNGGLGLTVLNCCDSARGGSGFLSVGASLVNSGVPLVVAMQFAITDGAASRFAGQFYSSITSGCSVEQSLTIARQFMRLQSNVEWGIPVLYTRTGTCVLFEVGAPGRAAQQPLPESMMVAKTSENRAHAREELRRLFA
jgi:hypothetical protein